MVALISGLAAWVTVLIASDLARRFPGEALADYAPRLLGRWPGRVFLGLYTLALAMSMGTDLAIGVDGVLGLFLQYTPTWVILVLNLTVILLTLMGGMVRAGYVAPGFLLFLLVADVTLLVGLGDKMEIGYLRPLWSPQQVQWGSLPFWAALASCRSAQVVPAAVTALHSPRRAPLLATVGHWLGYFIMLPMVLAPVLLFGPEGAQSTENPVLSLLWAIRIPNLPIYDRPGLLIRPVGNLSALITTGITLIAAAGAARAFLGRRLAGAAVPMLVTGSAVFALLLVRRINTWDAIQWPLLAQVLLVQPAYLFMWVRALWLQQREKAPLPPGSALG